MSNPMAKTRDALRATLPVALALAVGALLRIWMFREFPQDEGDSLIYCGLAKNLLLHGRYAITDGSGVLHETLIRLPGYPLFLAACFKMFGVDNYSAVAYVQIALELLGCLLLAGFVRRIAKPEIRDGAALATLWLAALCPFTASYAAAPLTETPTLFAIALALWAVARFNEKPAWGSALWFTFAITFAAMLRPDGALVGVALAPALVAGLRGGAVPRAKLAKMAVVCILLATIPFAAWTARNWRVFHVVQPLAPRYANDPDEVGDPGWQRWVKTWCLDFISTYDIYWNVPGGPFDVSKLPARAFDSPAEYSETAALATEYMDNGQEFTPGMDARFARLAEERIRTHPLRYYLWLPLGRLADMWLRPRVENLPIDMDWWVYAHHNSETRFSWEYAGLNAAFLLLALAGLSLRPRFWPWLLLYMVLRSGLLMTIEAPETRYTLECFPMLFVLAGVAVGCGLKRMGKRKKGIAASI
ncbi:MAG: glycosyltransferase family 39 protein [Terracidiphilus sp.]